MPSPVQSFVEIELDKARRDHRNMVDPDYEMQVRGRVAVAHLLCRSTPSFPAAAAGWQDRCGS